MKLKSPLTRYLAFNKPYGVLSSFTDPARRPTLATYISIPTVYPIGRLDYDSEGLLLLTSDGRLSHQVADPQFKLWKTYLVQVERIPDESALNRLRGGVTILDKRTRKAMVEVLKSEPSLPPRPVPIRFRKTVPTVWLQIKIQEGMNRQVRRMTAAVGHPTLRLIRIGVGPVRLGNLQPGDWRQLRKDEVLALKMSFSPRNIADI